MMTLKLAVIVCVSFALAFCSFTCAPQKTSAVDHCEKPAKDASKRSTGCCHIVKALVEKNSHFGMATIILPVSAVMLHITTFETSMPFTALYLSSSDPPTHKILRA